MEQIELFNFQKKVLEETKGRTRVAYYMDMGTGKTFVGSEKAHELKSDLILVICQKNKVADWVKHFNTYYNYHVFDLTNKKQFNSFLFEREHFKTVGVINYDLVWRRDEFKELTDFVLMLDESSLIQNEGTRRSWFILNRLHTNKIILLSGTPTAGKYEKLYSQCKLLGWEITKKEYWDTFINYRINWDVGFPLKIVKSYKNEAILKRQLHNHGAIFLTTEQAKIDLPEKRYRTFYCNCTKEYKEFSKNGIVNVDGTELVGDHTFSEMLHKRELCGAYNKEKIELVKELLEGTEDRIIFFYNFDIELNVLKSICKELDRPVAEINGSKNEEDKFKANPGTVLLIQYQAGARGGNYQIANQVAYFTPPLSSELFEQSKARVCRLGQEKSTCMYYRFLTNGYETKNKKGKMVYVNSIEESIYNTLAMRRDYTEELFESDNSDME